MRRPSVLLVAHRVHDRGGMEHALAQLIRRASDEVDFHVLSADLQHDLRSAVVWTPVRTPLRPVPVLMASFWAASSLLARHVARDLVHTMGAIAPLHADLTSVQFCHAAFQALPRDNERRASFFIRSNTALARKMSITTERLCYRPERLRHFAPASAGVASELHRLYPRIPTTVIPNAADHVRFRPDASTRRTLRTALGVHNDDVVALFLGGDWQRKGLDVTIEGIARARSAGAAKVVLWVVGAGDVQRYRARALALDDSPWCTFHGFAPHPENFLAAADLLVSPTRYEAFPLAALEAAACGLPVVATRVNGIAELIRDGREGRIVTRTASSIAAAITELAADPTTRRRMGTAAQASAAHYTWSGVAQATLATYDLLLSTPAGKRTRS